MKEPRNKPSLVTSLAVAGISMLLAIAAISAWERWTGDRKPAEVIEELGEIDDGREI